MQPLFVQVTTTFIGDAIALVNGFGRIVTHSLMAPLERIAKACDVAGILPERAARAAEREQVRHMPGTPSASAGRSRIVRAGMAGCSTACALLAN